MSTFILVILPLFIDFENMNFINVRDFDVCTCV